MKEFPLVSEAAVVIILLGLHKGHIGNLKPCLGDNDFLCLLGAYRAPSRLRLLYGLHFKIIAYDLPALRVDLIIILPEIFREKLDLINLAAIVVIRLCL